MRPVAVFLLPIGELAWRHQRATMRIHLLTNRVFMSQEIRVAFVASAALKDGVKEFVRRVEQAPETSHSALLEPVLHEFLDGVLDAFFHGPVRAVGATGPVVNIINGVVNVIGKASRGMAGRLAGRSTPAEQQALARHFQSMWLERDGEAYISFPLESGLANRMLLTFDEFAEGQGETRHLVEVMRALADNAVACFLDDSVACIRLGTLNRGLVATARSTIVRSSHMAIEKALPAMTPAHRGPVLNYFRGLLLAG